MNDTDQASLALLQQQVRELLDRQAITDCVLRYARGLDRHDEEIFSSVFHEDAIDHHGSFLGYRDEFVPWGLDLLASQWDAHTHFISNVRIEIDGDVAHSECYVHFVQRRRDRPVIDIGGGRYIDRLERRDEWRVSARELVIEWTAEASTTTFGGVEDYPHGAWDRSDPSFRRPFELPQPS